MAEVPAEKKTSIFDGGISMGNAITICVLLFGLITGWSKISNDVDNLRKDFASYKQVLSNDFVRKDVAAERDRALMDQITIMRKQLERIEAKVDKQ